MHALHGSPFSVCGRERECSYDSRSLQLHGVKCLRILHDWRYGRMTWNCYYRHTSHLVRIVYELGRRAIAVSYSYRPRRDLQRN